MVFWLCGLSGSGKSTIAQGVLQKCREIGINVYILDGDKVRETINSDLGFSIQDREENIRRAAWIARILSEAGVNVLCTFITPSHRMQNMARKIVGEDIFRMVYIKASIETCRKRDPKGLYQKVEEGTVKDFTGVHQTFEEPVSPDIIIDTENLDVKECVSHLFNFVLYNIRK